VDGCPEDGGNMLFQNVGTHISNALGRQVWILIGYGTIQSGRWLPWRSSLCVSDTLVPTHHTMWCHNLEGHNLDFYSRENLKSEVLPVLYKTTNETRFASPPVRTIRLVCVVLLENTIALYRLAEWFNVVLVFVYD
jgi:hypothetical protein